MLSIYTYMHMYSTEYFQDIKISENFIAMPQSQTLKQ